MPFTHENWKAINDNNAITFQTAIEIIRGLNIKDGEKRLENEKVFRTQLLALLGALVISNTVSNQLALAQSEPSVMLAGTLSPLNTRPRN